jgi:hypothetical protein
VRRRAIVSPTPSASVALAKPGAISANEPLSSSAGNGSVPSPNPIEPSLSGTAAAALCRSRRARPPPLSIRPAAVRIEGEKAAWVPPVSARRNKPMQQVQLSVYHPGVARLPSGVLGKAIEDVTDEFEAAVPSKPVYPTDRKERSR